MKVILCLKCGIRTSVQVYQSAITVQQAALPTLSGLHSSHLLIVHEYVS